MGQVSTRTAWSAPQGSIWAFSTQSDLASPANGLAQPAVSRDVIPGHETIHNPTFLNDGYYGNGSSWIGTGPDSWIKIDLGQTVPVGNVRFGRDRIGHFDDRDPGRFQVFVATTDDVYANGNDQNDSQEYRSVFDSENVGFSGQISGSQTLLATFPAIEARYVKIRFGADGAAIDEVEVMPAAEGSVATAVEAAPEADACATAPCGEFAVCTDLPGALTTAAGRSCACSTGYSGDGAGGCAPAAPLSWKMAADSRSAGTNTAMRAISSLWTDKTAARVNTSTYSWDQLGGESAVVSKLRTGQVDAAFLSTAGLTQLSGDTIVLNIPGMVRSRDERQELLTKLGPTLEKGLQDRGFVVLAWSELAPLHVFSSSARPTLAGLQQAKLGAVGAYGWKELLVSWGLKPTIMGYPDFIPSLNTSNVDSLVWSTSAVYSYQVYSKVPYMSDLVWSTQDQAL
ncbi:MAG TPA: TRAP transporter substrate-binding protein DctP, partial [Myxococcota bacterium]|nr:TRAP transporter substrate-binding protein DctP [Myxococcota bacterium]